MTVTALSTSGVVEAAGGLVPLLRDQARWIEDNRRLPEVVLEALEDAGVCRLRVPTRYGGLDATSSEMLAVARALGRGDGSTAWTASVWWIPTWMVGFFPREVQDEVFAQPNVRVCGTLSPGGKAVPADGGFRINGSWSFISGAHHSHWQEVIVLAPTPDGESMYPVVALIPMSELSIIDDWHTGAVRGSGSVTTIANDVFVPAARVLPLPAILAAHPADDTNAASPIYQVPFSAYAASASVGTLMGIADGALEAFEERLRSGKGITYTDYESAAHSPITHMQVARATLSRDQAGFHADRVTSAVDRKAVAGEQWSLIERAQARVDGAEVARLVVEATSVLDEASGGSSIRLDAPIQRMARDARGIAKHALIYPTSAVELYGRLLSGLEPNTSYI